MEIRSPPPAPARPPPSASAGEAVDVRGFVNITSRPLFPICRCCCSSPFAKRISSVVSFACSSCYFVAVFSSHYSLFPSDCMLLVVILFYFVLIGVISRSFFCRSYVFLAFLSFFTLLSASSSFPLRFLIHTTSPPRLPPVRTLIHFPFFLFYASNFLFLVKTLYLYVHVVG